MDPDVMKPLSLGGSFFHLTNDLVNEAVQRVPSSDAQGEASIHRLRVIFKILRSRHQLIRPLLHPSAYRFANQRLKSAADELADRRDRDVLLKTHAKLLGKTSGKKSIQSMKSLKLMLEKEQERTLAPIDWTKVKHRLKAETAFWKRQSTHCEREWGHTMLEGLCITYGKARKRYQRAYAEQDRQLFHDWRKWTKYLLYQLQLLETMGCKTLKKRIQALTQLSKRLGKHHDLHVYRQRIHQISASDFGSDQLARCDVRIKRSEKTLETQCKKIAKGWFKEKPSAFKEAMHRKWMRNWQEYVLSQPETVPSQTDPAH